MSDNGALRVGLEAEVAAVRAGADSLRTSAYMAGRRGWPEAVKEAEQHALTLDALADRLTPDKDQLPSVPLDSEGL